MDFGVVLQTNPPAWRTVALAKQAEEHGFDYVWTFDSHLLWQEPYVIFSQILAETNRVIEGSAWGGYRTEFYPTYDFKPVWDAIPHHRP